MSEFEGAKQVEAWSKPPVAGCNQSTVEIAKQPLSWYRDNVQTLYENQYSQPSCWEDRYRRFMKLDDTDHKTIMDFGCGFGLDALSYLAKNYGNSIILADIVPSNLIVATNCILSQAYAPRAMVLATVDTPFFQSDPIDIFHSAGVLHHTPFVRSILKRAVEILNEDGEIRLMLYTDHLWRIATRTEPGSIEQDVRHHPMFDHYVRFCDAVGSYSDWYSREKLEYRFGDFLEITFFDYLREDKGYCVCHMKPK